jgi:DNA-binding transcriptional MerR regulator
MAKTFDYKTWWKKEKEKRNAERRAKYRSDPRYRETQKRRFREHYQETRQNIQPVDRRTVVSGSGRLFVTIGRVGRLIGRQPNSIRRYHKQGVIPEPRFYDARGWRLYTPSQTELLRNVFARFDNPNDQTVRSLADIRRMLEAGWQEMTPLEIEVEEETRGHQEAATQGRRSRSSR